MRWRKREAVARNWFRDDTVDRWEEKESREISREREYFDLISFLVGKTCFLSFIVEVLLSISDHSSPDTYIALKCTSYRNTP